jgi:hypothetical protein
MSVPLLDFTQACSFCEKEKSQVGWLIAGPRASMCDECIHLSAGILVANRGLMPVAEPSSRCAAHSEEKAISVCLRCGAFSCAACTPIDHRATGYCAVCRKLTEQKTGSGFLDTLQFSLSVIGFIVVASVVLVMLSALLPK